MLTRIGRIDVALFMITVLFAVAGCSRDEASGNSQGRPILVTVSGYSNKALSNVTVVLGDSNGTMKAYGTTDSNGQITFADAPANATVTAAMSCLHSGATTTTNSLDVRYDVNEDVVIYLEGCTDWSGVPASGPSTLGTVTINVTNALSDVVSNEILNMPILNSSLMTQETLTIEPYDLQKDGKLSIIVIGRDAAGNPVGYGALLDQTFIDKMTVNVSVDQPMSYIQYNLTNMPATANFLCSGILQRRMEKDRTYYLSVCNGLSPEPSSTSISVPYIPGLGDQFSYQVSLEVTLPDADSRCVQFLEYQGASAPSDQSFDFNTALSAVSPTVSGADTARPTLSWTAVDPAAQDFYVFAQFHRSSLSSLYLSFDDLSLGRTSVTFPELPDSLAAFRPAGVELFGVSTSAFDANVMKSSYGWYMNSAFWGLKVQAPHYVEM